MANIFDKSIAGAKSKTGLSKNDVNSPPFYVEVNPRKGSKNEFGAFIVNFQWDLLADVVSLAKTVSETQSDTFFTEKAVTNTKKEFIDYLTNYFRANKLYVDGVSLDENLNRFANQSITSIRTNNADKLGTGTASISLECVDYQWIFQHNDKQNNDFKSYSELFGKPIFLEGLYFTIDGIGRYNPNKYYRIFTGSISSVTFVDNPLERRIELQAKDLSRLLGISRYNTHPAFLESDMAAIQLKPTIFSSNLANMSNIDIANIVIPDIDAENGKWSNQVDKYSPASLREMWKAPDLIVETKKTPTGDTDIVKHNFQVQYSKSAASFDKKDVPTPYKLIWGNKTSSGEGFAKDENNHPIYNQMFKISQLRMSEFKTRIDLLNEVSMLSLFATYIDGSGNIHFHPYRYDYLNMGDEDNPSIPLYEGDTGITQTVSLLNQFSRGFGEENFITERPPSIEKENKYIYTLDPGESLSETSSMNEDDIVTALRVNGQGDFGIWQKEQQIDPAFARPFLLWRDGARRYGLRERNVSTSAFNKGEQLESFAIALFMRLYLEREKMTVTMPFRPELQIDRPFYIKHRKHVYHIKGISHSYSAGSDRGPGDFTTTVTLFAGRPLKWGNILHTNLFRTKSPEELYEVYRQNGFNIEVNYLDENGVKIKRGVPK